MPPGFLSPLDRLGFCESRECIQRVVDDYLAMLFSGSENFHVFRDEEPPTDERTVTNSYLFTEALIGRLLEAETELDLDAIVEDLRNRLGNNHPVLMFLKQLMDE
ncbi:MULTISPECIES: hypothetical protein [Metallosphaera]|nr:hypothetical protein [Metallosphaera sedula]MCH1770574.1 hypothetical protein [Metallosphaera sedula]MCP6728772.1 hypothetical protein [Metallosphaera sedula]